MKKATLILMVLGLFVMSSAAMADGRFSSHYNGPKMEPIYNSGPFEAQYNAPGMTPVYDSDEIDKWYNDPSLEPIYTSGPVDRAYNAPVLLPKYDVEYRDGHRSRYVKVKSQKVAE